MARRNRPQVQRSPIPTIIGAGLTEQWYFTHLQQLFGYRMKIRPRFFGREDAYQLMKKIESVIADGGVAIAVFDADVSSWDQMERTKLADIKRKYAKNKNVVLCDSLPSIEYWFLLHYADVHRLFPSSESVIEVLSRHIAGYDKTEAFLRNVKWVADLCTDGKMSEAVARAKKCKAGQSYTNLPLALERLK